MFFCLCSIFFAVSLDFAHFCEGKKISFLFLVKLLFSLFFVRPKKCARLQCHVASHTWPPLSQLFAAPCITSILASIQLSPSDYVFAMDPLEYLAYLMTRIERLSRSVELGEEQLADWIGRAAALEEGPIMGLSMPERREREKKIRVCLREAERVEELLNDEKVELEELEEARAGLERAGFRVW